MVISSASLISSCIAFSFLLLFLYVFNNIAYQLLSSFTYNLHFCDIPLTVIIEILYFFVKKLLRLGRLEYNDHFLNTSYTIFFTFQIFSTFKWLSYGVYSLIPTPPDVTFLKFLKNPLNPSIFSASSQ